MSAKLLPSLFLTISAVIAGCIYDNPQRCFLARELYPIKPTFGGWTTSKIFERTLHIDDKTFRSVEILPNTTGRVLEAPDGVVSLEAFYPKGSYTFGYTPRGGLSFYAPGPEDVDLTTAREATFAYTVLFLEGFDWVKGGKIPGFCTSPFPLPRVEPATNFCLAVGGRDFNTSLSCSGGRKATDCFSIRLMWRTGGMGEFYTYLPPFTIPGYESNEAQCHVPPYSECNPEYGNSVGRGALNFTSGQRGTVAMRVLLNDVGVANG